MSLEKCEECGHQVSSEAKACPGCGAKTRKKAGPIAWIFAGLVLFAIISSSNEPPPPPKTAEQLAQEQATASRSAKAVAAMMVIKKSLRDPDSVKWESVLVSADTSVVCATYKAKNGFGGYSEGVTIFVHGIPVTGGRCEADRFFNHTHDSWQIP